jgi:putative ubiquitin-RnfH superfamily antitoxin RatB of RatAB toxin-antitoxin module
MASGPDAEVVTVEVVTVEVVFATPERQELIKIQVPAESSVREAVVISGMASLFPEHDLEKCRMGIWGIEVHDDRCVGQGDRIELYRALAIDPRDARRLLAAEGRSMGPQARK